jgi:hypothetical protein
MPNWCSNNFSITGCVESIKDLWEAAQTANDGEFGLLEAIAPMPASLNDTVADGSEGMNWYNWRVSNWGTKWDVSDEGLEFIDHGDGTASITGWFESAWAPPIGAYEQLAADFDSCIIEASYFEPGMDFAGFWSSEAGEEHMDDLHDVWENDPDNELFKQLDEEYNLSEQFAEWAEEFLEEE